MRDVAETLGDFDAGVFMDKVQRGLAHAARNTVDYGDKGKKGKVTITLTLERIGESSQVQVSHAVETTVPMPRGKVTEVDLTTTAMYVGPKGVMTIAPDNQMTMFGEND